MLTIARHWPLKQYLFNIKPSYKPFFFAFFAMLLLMTITPMVHAAELQGIGLRAGSHHGQLVLRTSGTVSNPRAFFINNPYRIIVDLPHTSLTSQQAIRSLKNARGHGVKDIRYGVLRSHDLRLVLDMDPGSRYAPQIHRYGNALHIDFLPEKSRPAAHHSAPASTRNLPAYEQRRNVVIVIDPGHGGKDSGTIGPGGIYEKNVVLPIGRDIVRDLNAETGFEAYLTRTGDYYLTLPQRVVIAREHRADFFISVHANTVDSPRPHGTIVFALSEHGATSTMASWMAQRENTSSMLGGGGSRFLDLSGDSIPLRQTLIDLNLSSKTAQSILAGKDLVSSIGRVNPLFTHRVERANFAVLRSPDIPSVLIETDFLSNAAARRRLSSPVDQRRMAAAIARGISQYFKQHPPRGTWLEYKQDHPGTRLGPVKAPHGNMSGQPVSSHSSASSYINYRVKSGDSLSAIAVRYHTSMTRIQSANNLHSQVVQVGQVLRIPR